MQALASAYDQTVLLVPVSKNKRSKGEVWFTDPSIRIVPLTPPYGSGLMRKLLFPFWFLSHLPKFISETRKADVVHAPVPGDIGTIGMILGPLFHKKTYVRYCGDSTLLKTPAEKFWLWYARKYAGKRIAYLCTGGSDQLPVKNNPSVKWIFSSSMLQSEVEKYHRREFDFSKEFNIVMGGRLIKEKGFGQLIDAVSLISDKIPNLKVALFGDGPDAQQFEQQVKSVNLDSKIKFLGKLNAAEVHDVLNTADIFCFPTYSSEGFPKVVIEAMAHGIPVISTAVSVIPNLINETGNEAGFIIEKKSVEPLAEKILYYYNNPWLHKVHGDNAKSIAYKYTLENWVDTIDEQLNSQWKTGIHRLRSIIK